MIDSQYSFELPRDFDDLKSTLESLDVEIIIVSTEVLDSITKVILVYEDDVELDIIFDTDLVILEDLVSIILDNAIVDENVLLEGCGLN